MTKSNKSNDLALALHQFDCVGITENAVFPRNANKENYQPKTLVDRTLEDIDPTPNIYTLFVQFNLKFFWNVLLPVEVKWSNRMTSCAGTCTFRPRSRECVITLSAPLLKLRPRKDLVETLLHEMIHGYLFLTNNNRDRDGHGPEFCKHMNRINNEAGTNITIYHTFNAEVKLYQQHWWRCDGPCQHRAPYFGTVRRAMNRAPGPSDFWYADHQRSCGGQFIKVREPERKKPNPKTKNLVPTKKNIPNSQNIYNWFPKESNSQKSPTTQSNSRLLNGGNNMNDCQNNSSTKNIPYSNATSNIKSIGNDTVAAGITKLGTGANKVHGWGTAGPGNVKGNIPVKSNSTNPGFSSPISSVAKPGPKLSYSGRVGGTGAGRSNLLDKFYSSATSQNRINVKSHLPVSKSTKNSSVNVTGSSINKPNSSPTKVAQIIKKNTNETNITVSCPVCDAIVSEHVLNSHLDECLEKPDKKCHEKSKSLTHHDDSTNNLQSNDKSTLRKVPIAKAKVKSPIILDDPSPVKKRKALEYNSTDSKQPKLDFYKAPEMVDCPVCNVCMETEYLNSHLDTCLNESAKKREQSLPSTVTQSTPKRMDSDIKNISNASDSFSGNKSIFEISSSSTVSDTPESPLLDTSKSYKCLVCNNMVKSNISLNDHLEECVGTVFSDDSDPFIDEPQTENATNVETKFPCPICLELVLESIMNQHLDVCLEKDQ